MEGKATILGNEGTQKPDDQHQDAGPAADAGKGEEGKATWRDKLSDPALKASKSLARYSSEEDLAKGYLELERTLGSKIDLPGKDAKPEDWDRFYSRVGRPEKADDYKLDGPEGFQPDATFVQKLKASLHGAGLSQDMAEKVYRFFAEEAVAQGKAAGAAKAEAEKADTEAFQAAQAELKSSWGNQYDAKLEFARRYATRVGGEGAIQHLEDLGVASDPLVLRLLAAAGEATANHRFVHGVTPKGQPEAGPYSYMNKDKSE